MENGIMVGKEQELEKVSKYLFIFFKEFIWFKFRMYEKLNLYDFIVTEGNTEMAGLFQSMDKG